MVKISFIASGIILGLATISSASASIISRSFLDQALTDYATNTALDLKANQSDLTALSNKIGTLPDGITLENFYKGWVDSGGESMAEFIAKHHGLYYTYDPVNDDVGPVKFPDVGYLDVLASLMDQEGFVPAENSVLAPFYYLTKQAMRVGEIPRGKTVAGMIDEINTKIGTLPTESTSGQSIWYRYGFVKMTSTPIELPDTIGGIFSMLFNGDYSYTGPSLNNILNKILGGFTDGGGNTETYGLYRLTRNIKSITDQIGTLPSEYSTVGAALTAMKSDIDAKNLPSTSDDGQYVLSAKKVGDTITYTWVKMDLTSEEQAQ